MADKDCKCLQCEAERQWKDDPRADALISKLSQMAISGAELTMSDDDSAASPITLIAWIGMSLYQQAVDCAKIMTAFDSLSEEDQESLLKRFRKEDSEDH